MSSLLQQKCLVLVSLASEKEKNGMDVSCGPRSQMSRRPKRLSTTADVAYSIVDKVFTCSSRTSAGRRWMKTRSLKRGLTMEN